MQHTLLHVQAALSPANKNRQQPQGMDFGFWVTMLLLILLGSLGAYSISTSLPGAQFASQLLPATDGPQPTLTLVGTNTSIITVGQALHVHGEHFGAYDTIVFVLDTRTTGVSVHSTIQGTFEASIPIPSTWLAGAYALEALDTHTGKHAFLNLQILPGTKTTNTTALALEDAQGKALAPLTFTTAVSKGDPAEQRFYLKNTSATAFQWTVAAVTDGNLGWLLVDDGVTGGTLKARAAFSIRVSAVTTGLQIGSYTGHLIFTVANQGQAILPVTLTVADSTVEVVVTPNPILAVIQPGGTCQPITLTLVNLSNTAFIRWDIKGDNPYDQQHISINGGPEAQGNLSPSGQGESTIELKVLCSGVRLGIVYKITVYYNSTQIYVPIAIRQS